MSKYRTNVQTGFIVIYILKKCKIIVVCNIATFIHGGNTILQATKKALNEPNYLLFCFSVLIENVFNDFVPIYIVNGFIYFITYY